MLNEDIIIEQLDTLVKVFGDGTKAKFARKLGVSNARVGMWYARKFIDVMLIAESLPEVSAEWLLRFEGKLERSGNNDTKEGKTEPAVHFFEEDTELNTTNIKDEYKRLLDENKRIREDNNALREDVKIVRAERDMMFNKLMEKA